MTKKSKKRLLTTRITVALHDRYQKYIDSAPRQVSKESVIEEALKRELDRRDRAKRKAR